MSFRKILHAFRTFVAIAIWPALALVVYGELAHSSVLHTLEIDVWDKALHFTAYFGLALMATISVRADRRAIWCALALVALGGALEVIQGMTGRDADIWDETANTLGVLTGALLGWIGVWFLKRRKLVDDAP
jgi:VanZ family protein